MLKLKKGLSFLTALAISASCFPMMAMAEGETTVEPEILFYRDYEDYKGGNHQWYSDGIGDYSGNNSKFYGTWNWSIDDSAAKPSMAVDGFDGKAVKYHFSNANLSYSTNQGSFTDISDGKLYYAFDMWGDENDDNRAMNLKLVGETDKEIYVLCWYPGVRWCKGNVSWMTGETSTEFMNGVSKKTRVELVIDPKAGTVDKYFNGNFAQQATFTPQTITSATMYISEGHTMDNFAVVHYPENYTDSFSVTDAKVNMKDNSISVFLNSNAYDSNGAQVKGDATFNYPIAAPYGVTLASTDTSSFAVAKGDAPLTVTGVLKGEANGEYVVSISEPITTGTYTVSLGEGIEDICANVVNPAGNSKTIAVETEPQILLYRDFEDYQGGNGFSNTGQYGTFKMNFDNDYGWGNSTPEVGRTKTGFRSNTINAAMYKKYIPEAVRAAKSGYLYTSVTSEAIEGATRSGRFAMVGKDGYRYFGFTHGANYSVDQWGTSAVSTPLPAELQNLDYYKIEIIFDLETGKQYNFINGQNIKTCNMNSGADFANGDFNFYFEDGVIVDNLMMLYYPKAIVPQTFSLKADEIDVENDTIKVSFVSDACDSDGASGLKISAPYGVILNSEVSAEDFEIEGCTVVGVESTGAYGEYVISVAEDLKGGTIYKVSADEALKDSHGAEFSGNVAEIQVITEAEVFYYRDFEEYEGGNPWPSADSKKYGKMGLFGDSAFANSTKVETATGTGVQLDTKGTNPKITEGSIFGPLTDGTLYIAYEEVSGGKREDIYFNRASEGGNDGSNLWCWNGTAWASGASNWSVNTTTGLEAGLEAKYKIELVVDLEKSLVDRYINGVCVQNDRTLKAKEFKELTFAFSTGSVIDNMSIIYFPEKLVSMPTFSMSAGDIDAEANTVSVSLNSDAVDSDALADGSAVAAPYGVSLAEFDASSFAVDGYTVTAVSKGDAVGEYVITLAEDITDDASLTVTAADGLADILGSVVNADSKSVTVGASEYSLSDVTIDGAKASISYTNTTKKPESFVLVIASYVGDQMSDVNFENVTAATGSQNVEASVSLQTSVEGKTVKAFVLKDFTSLTPIK